MKTATNIFGYTWEDIQARQQGTYQPTMINLKPGKDYGHNGKESDGLFTMVPSGDRVTFEEMQERLNK